MAAAGTAEGRHTCRATVSGTHAQWCTSCHHPITQAFTKTSYVCMTGQTISLMNNAYISRFMTHVDKIFTMRNFRAAKKVPLPPNTLVAGGGFGL